MQSKCVAISFVSFSIVPACLPPPIAMADTNAIQKAFSVLKKAERPLVIVGKGTCVTASKILVHVGCTGRLS